MPIDLKVPEVGESITEVMVGEWLKKEGDFVDKGETIVVLETDKVNAEIEAPESGILKEILKQADEDAEVGEVIGRLEPGEDEGESAGSSKPEASGDDAKDASDKADDSQDSQAEKAEPKKSDKPAEDGKGAEGETRIMPAARRMLDEHGLEADKIDATGPGGRLLKEDVQRYLEEGGGGSKAGSSSEDTDSKKSQKPRPAGGVKSTGSKPSDDQARGQGSRDTERVRMTPLRRRVAGRLVEAQQQAALLTTFNEIDMSAVIGLRKSYQEDFVKKYDIKVGFMSFFVKATIEALKEVPQVNAQIEGEEVVYHNYFDIGVAIGGGKGLVVPIIRNAERLSFAGVEKAISDYATRAKGGKLKLEELQGGTFTISNGGVYGSLLSTPIVNPPQSGILGLHKIEERPVAVDGQVVIRPMMYVALTYDHRIVDGREAVTFLVKIKERIEDPTRILLEV